MKTSNKILSGIFALTLISIGIILFTFRNDITGKEFHNDQKYKLSGNDYSFIQKYKVSSPVNLYISTSGGNIAAMGYEGDTTEVTFVVKKRNITLDLNLEGLKKIADVEISLAGSNLNIKINRCFERNISVSFIIKTPVKSSLNLNTSGGNIVVSELTGKQIANTSGGNIFIDKILGDADLGTSGGNISLNNSTGNIRASTSGGNISIDKIDGTLDVSTSGGNINASSIKKGLLAHTSGGNIDVKNAQGPVDVNTSGGSISLVDLSGSVKAITSGGEINADITRLTEKLELETSGGSIKAIIPNGLGLDLDLSADQIKTPLSNFKGISKEDRIKGKINGGGIPVRLSSDGGFVLLNYK
jgi:hypothetical protein